MQDGFAPGDVVRLTASLWEYQSPLKKQCSVWAHVVEPDGNRSATTFTRTAAGSYAATWTTTLPGVSIASASGLKEPQVGMRGLCEQKN